MGERQQCTRLLAGSSSLDFDSAAEEEAALLSASITDEQLHVLTGTHELSTVRFLQMAVDSEFVPLNCLGDRLPALEQLKLNGSCLPSLRHLGTSLCQVRVLWLCRCGLQELDNLGALPELQVGPPLIVLLLEIGDGLADPFPPRTSISVPLPAHLTVGCCPCVRCMAGVVLGLQRYQAAEPTGGVGPAASARLGGQPCQ